MLSVITTEGSIQSKTVVCFGWLIILVKRIQNNFFYTFLKIKSTVHVACQKRKCILPIFLKTPKQLLTFWLLPVQGVRDSLCEQLQDDFMCVICSHIDKKFSYFL